MRSFFMITGTIICIVILFFCSPVYAQQNIETIQVTTASVGDIYRRVITSGTVNSNDIQSITAPSMMQVKKIEVSSGDYVEKGEALMVAETYQNTTVEDNVTAAAYEMMDAFSQVLQDIYPGLESISNEIIEENSINVFSGTLSGNQIVIYSTISGVVTEVNVSEGDDIAAGYPCFTIADLENMSVTFNIPEKNVNEIDIGMVCNFSGDAFQKVYTGEVVEISPVAQTVGAITGNSSTVVEAKASIKNPDGLRPGYSSKVTVFTDLHRDTLLIPYEALSQDEGGNNVLFVVEDGLLIKKIVEIGFEQAELVEICSGIDENDIIALYPEDDWENGKQVKEEFIENK